MFSLIDMKLFLNPRMIYLLTIWFCDINNHNFIKLPHNDSSKYLFKSFMWTQYIYILDEAI